MPSAPRAGLVGGRREVSEVAMDSCFLSKDAGSESLAVLVLKGRDSRAMLARPVLCKGRLRSDTIEQAADSVRRLGLRGRFLLKTDNEPALVDLRQG
eukprot:15346976-Alexandrium_andersonii.AAC.1